MQQSVCVCVHVHVCWGYFLTFSVFLSHTHTSSLPHTFYSHKYISIYFHMCVSFLTVFGGEGEKPSLSALALCGCRLVLLAATQPG